MTLTEFAQAIVEGKPLVHRLTTTDPWVIRDPRSYLSAIVLADWKLKEEPPAEKTLGQIAYEAHKRSLENRGGYNIAWDKLRPEQQGDWEIGAEAVANKVGVAILHGPKSSHSINRAIDQGLRAFDYRDEGKIP